MNTTAMARLETAVVAAHNAVYDWCVAQEAGFIGSAPAHLLAAVDTAEHDLWVARQAMFKERGILLAMKAERAN